MSKCKDVLMIIESTLICLGYLALGALIADVLIVNDNLPVCSDIILPEPV